MTTEFYKIIIRISVQTLVVRFEVVTEVTMNNGVFWDVTPCGSCKNRSFGGTQRLLHQGDSNRWTGNNASCNYQSTHAAKKYQVRSVRRLLVTASVVPSSPIPLTLMKEALCSSETAVLTRVIRRNIPEDAILHSHRRENIKSYIALTGWTL
jgi:hypothetical protein